MITIRAKSTNVHSLGLQLYTEYQQSPTTYYEVPDVHNSIASYPPYQTMRKLSLLGDFHRKTLHLDLETVLAWTDQEEDEYDKKECLRLGRSCAVSFLAILSSPLELIAHSRNPCRFQIANSNLTTMLLTVVLIGCSPLQTTKMFPTVVLTWTALSSTRSAFSSLTLSIVSLYSQYSH